MLSRPTPDLDPSEWIPGCFRRGVASDTVYFSPRNGVHRYAWLLFTQPADFTAPASPAAGAGAGHWNVSSYVEEAGLTLVAASYFTVVNGAPSGESNTQRKLSKR